MPLLLPLLLAFSPAALAGPASCVSHRGQTSSTDETQRAQENTWLNLRAAICTAEQLGLVPAAEAAPKACRPARQDAALSRALPNVAAGEEPRFGVEFDVWHSADGVGLLSHGDVDGASKVETIATDADGACPVSARISEVSWAALSEHCAPRYADAEATMEVLRLDWILRALAQRNPHVAPVVELKDIPSRATVAALSDFAGAHPGLLRVISFRPRALDRMHLTSGAPRDHYRLWLLASPAVPPYEARVAYDGLDLELKVPRDTPKLQREGFTVGVWTPNEPRDMAAALLDGAQVLTTDELARCVETVRAGPDAWTELAAQQSPLP